MKLFGKKGLVTALITSVLVVAMAVPAMAAYTPNWYTTYGSMKYEGQRVQVAKFTTSMYQNATPFYQPYYPNIMSMSVNEALVDSNITDYFDPTYGSFRMGIAGKVGSGMMEGWVIDNHFKVASVANNVYAHARVGLTAWAFPTGTGSAGADIPAGARFTTPTNTVTAYADGSRIKISGYYYQATWYARDAYVNTNWASGSTSQYYVQFTQ